MAVKRAVTKRIPVAQKYTPDAMFFAKARSRAATKMATKKAMPGSKNRAMEMDDFPSGKPAKRKPPIPKSPFKR